MNKCFFDLKYSSNTKYIDVNNWSSKQGPPMNEAKRDHGCATASYKGAAHVFVVGGYNGNYESLDSMEVFNVTEERWIDDFRSTKLPFPLAYLQVVHANSPDFLVYAVGGRDSNLSPVSTIYGLNKHKQWKKIGDLKTKRNTHATINSGLNAIPGCPSK